MKLRLTSHQSSWLPLALVTSLILLNVTDAQRSLHHWKRDLELRLGLYNNQRNVIQNIIASSIDVSRPGITLDSQNDRARILSNGDIRFSELVIPSGSLILENHLALPTVRTLVNKTMDYLHTRMQTLSHVRNQLDEITGQLNGRANVYIYKGSRGVPQPQFNTSRMINGTMHLKQVIQANLIDSKRVIVPNINRSNVDRVIDATYLRNLNRPVDQQNRLFFEGRKEFLNTVFGESLISGCCDRLLPLHTNRMMLRSRDQEVRAPIVIMAGGETDRSGGYSKPAVFIQRLETKQLSNQAFNLGSPSNYPTNTPSRLGITYYSSPENIILFPKLISLYQMSQPKTLKTLIFKNAIRVDDMQLSSPYTDSRFRIGLDNKGSEHFDLSHDRYLLRYPTSRNHSYEQLVTGTTILNGLANIQAGLEALSVNHLGDFGRFVREIVVRVDGPSVISGPVQFNAAPVPAYKPNQTPLSAGVYLAHNMLMLQSRGDLIVGTINGMHIPQDLIILPPTSGPLQNPSMPSLRPTDTIHIYGPRRFANQLAFNGPVQVSGLVNGMHFPNTVIPLHLNDGAQSSAAQTDLMFVDGLDLNQLIIQGGRFDEIILRDIHLDAQSLVMNSVFPRDRDGSIRIRAPLRVNNLNLFNANGHLNNNGLATDNNHTRQGLINGFRPQEIMELAGHPFDSLQGRKTFLAPVEATECIFNDINQVANWTSQLIRIDKPNTIQTVRSRLAFSNPPLGALRPANSVSNYTMHHVQPTTIQVDNLDVDFYPDSDPVHHRNNWNFAPELYLMHQALKRYSEGQQRTGGRYRCQKVHMKRSNAMVNNIYLSDIVTLDKPFRFKNQFTMVGKVELVQNSSLRASRIQSNYPIDKLDLVQFNNQRIPIYGSRPPIRLQSLALAQENRASFVHSRLINGISFNEFVNSIMSLTQPQFVDSQLIFNAQVNFEGPVRTESSLNGIKNFQKFANSLKNAKYSFEDGLQCNAVVLRTG